MPTRLPVTSHPFLLAPITSPKSKSIILPSSLKGRPAAFLVSLPFASTGLHTSCVFTSGIVSLFYLGGERGRVTECTLFKCRQVSSRVRIRILGSVSPHSQSLHCTDSWEARVGMGLNYTQRSLKQASLTQCP